MFCLIRRYKVREGCHFKSTGNLSQFLSVSLCVSLSLSLSLSLCLSLSISISRLSLSLSVSLCLSLSLSVSLCLSLSLSISLCLSLFNSFSPRLSLSLSLSLFVCLCLFLYLSASLSDSLLLSCLILHFRSVYFLLSDPNECFTLNKTTNKTVIHRKNEFFSSRCFTNEIKSKKDRKKWKISIWNRYSIKNFETKSITEIVLKFYRTSRYTFIASWKIVLDVLLKIINRRKHTYLQKILKEIITSSFLWNSFS